MNEKDRPRIWGESLGLVAHVSVRGTPSDMPALLRQAAVEIERNDLRVVSLAYQSDHADEYGAVLHLYVRER